MKKMRRQSLSEIALLVLAFGLPYLLAASGNDFYIGTLTRIMIFALAATSLNFIVGYGGMVAFGHAAFFGCGAYVVGLLMSQDIVSAWVSWPTAVAATMLLALPIGWVSLRTRGVHFIMITLAFAQMIYYITISMQITGGDDGLSLSQRSTLFPIELSNDTQLFHTSLGLLAITLYALKHLTLSRYGRALAGIRQNELRMEALGYPVRRLKLVCFIIGAALAGLAGALLANQNGMASPSQLYWTQSGLLLMMVILGGVGQRYGGVLGAFVFLGLEESLAQLTEHAHLFLGLFLLAVVIHAPHGLVGLLSHKR